MIERMADRKFELVSPYKPAGDQPQAIEKLTQGFLNGRRNRSYSGPLGQGKPLPCPM
ncbi:hypothetical protein [Lacticaseibacillus manihotivorans]|uniref:hypothetical protein n=1 Tax=Lacticaseibacillus manihotivorans TaxID=88233 RepID=UPI000B2C2396